MQPGGVRIGVLMCAGLLLLRSARGAADQDEFNGITAEVGTAEDEVDPNADFDVDVTHSLDVDGTPYGAAAEADGRKSATAPGNTNQSPQSKTIEVEGCFCSEEDCKKIEISVTITYTATQNEAGKTVWAISLDVTNVEIVQEKGRNEEHLLGTVRRGANLNGDGTLDKYGLTPSGLLETLLSNGSGGLSSTTYSLPAGMRAATAAGLDEDGDIDIAVSASSGVVRVFWNDSSGGLTPVDVTLPIGVSPDDITHYDFDRDGSLDLLISSPSSGEVGLLQNTAPQAFDWIGSIAAPDHGLDGDNIEALSVDAESPNRWVVKDGAAGLIQAYEGTTLKETLIVGGTAREFHVRKLETVGAEDVVVWNDADNEVVVFLGGAGGAFERTDYAIAETITAVHLEDVDGDGDVDIEVSTATGVVVLANDGAGGFSQ